MKGQTFFPSHGENCALLSTIGNKFLCIYCRLCVRENKKKPKQEHLLMLNAYLQFPQLWHIPVPIFGKMDI